MDNTAWLFHVDHSSGRVDGYYNISDGTSGVDSSQWHGDLRNNWQYYIGNESDYKYNEIHINKGKDNGGLGFEMLAYNADFLKNK
jgi:hypothetical protein